MEITPHRCELDFRHVTLHQRAIGDSERGHARARLKHGFVRGRVGKSAAASTVAFTGTGTGTVAVTSAAGRVRKVNGVLLGKERQQAEGDLWQRAHEGWDGKRKIQTGNAMGGVYSRSECMAEKEGITARIAKTNQEQTPESKVAPRQSKASVAQQLRQWFDRLLSVQATRWEGGT